MSKLQGVIVGAVVGHLSFVYFSPTLLLFYVLYKMRQTRTTESGKTLNTWHHSTELKTSDDREIVR